MAIEKARTDRMQRSHADLKVIEEIRNRELKLMTQHQKKYDHILKRDVPALK